MHGDAITGVILAGGQGRRMGGVDKGLQLLGGRPLVQWVADRFAPQVEQLLLNANQGIVQYRALGYPVITDHVSGFAGPLAGLHAALSCAAHPLVATAPCDSPFLPRDLVARLRSAMAQHGADLATARTFDQLQPVFCLCRRELLPQLGAFLERGERKLDLWQRTVNSVVVAFDDEAAAFRNINTSDELAAIRHDQR
ncbi:molybdenum cofactor guanylyltransferase MobA [Accumulibacter sp.]|uniref:molybdenum cofactor guanylyltransferase MobA n=1 Tax=Accumulibacter sp. TaxID=2053492 RepID=UPI0025DECA21|nr:molybdenum cofactor guanylyltransferase MobA [Accumulibacter sp.]MCP5229753.1 molybdenum cofactor guanylyltransferase [Accumulibacter sp.]